MPPKIPATVTVAQLPEFDEVIDVRSSSEFAEDHVPGALSCPVLDDEERARIGTTYKQVSAFAAKKAGAALVSRNIAHHLEHALRDKPLTWRPLVYCWRGGNRSGALAHVLAQIGWRAGQLDGGYRAYRRAVINDLEQLPARFRWRVVCGLTGSGKSRLLRALSTRGAQVLDLEAHAAHRGSVLGDLPDRPQPSQKLFESLLWNALRGFDPQRPVYVESESRKIGTLRVPQALIERMWGGECVKLDAGVTTRIALLREEYAHFADDVAALEAQLDRLAALYGHAVIHEWKTLARQGDWDGLVEALLTRHYDPAYTRSTLTHYPHLEHAPALFADGAEARVFERLADACLAPEATPPRAILPAV
ncbi:MAG: tRNA 2-selenouridine(34) synthase MnmH [Gammaproteobacteria bacterium]